MSTSDTAAQSGSSPSPLFGILGPKVMAIIEAAQAIHRDAQVYGMAGATNHPQVRCEVKGLCLKHWDDLAAALESLPNDEMRGAKGETKL